MAEGEGEGEGEGEEVTQRSKRARTQPPQLGLPPLLVFAHGAGAPSASPWMHRYLASPFLTRTASYGAFLLCISVSEEPKTCLSICFVGSVQGTVYCSLRKNCVSVSPH
jgi:hypothetical protein